MYRKSSNVSQFLKQYDKVWHDSIILKLKQNEISDIISNLLFIFFGNRKEKVVINGQVSSLVDANS